MNNCLHWGTWWDCVFHGVKTAGYSCWHLNQLEMHSLLSSGKTHYTAGVVTYMKSMKMGSWFHDSMKSELILYSSFGFFLLVTWWLLQWQSLYIHAWGQRIWDGVCDLVLLSETWKVFQVTSGLVTWPFLCAGKVDKGKHMALESLSWKVGLDWPCVAI